MDEYISYKLFCENKFEEIKELISRGKLIPMNAFTTCIKNNHTELAKYVHILWDDGLKLTYDAYICIQYNNFEMFKYIMSLGCEPHGSLIRLAARSNNLKVGKYLLSMDCGYTSEVTDIAIENGNIEFLKLLIEVGLKISDRSLLIACEQGNFDILILLLNLGYNLTKAPNVEYFGKYNRNIYKIYHELELQGRYQYRCKAGFCNLCHIVKIWKLWELESYEYNSYIQFLPREIFEDLETLIETIDF